MGLPGAPASQPPAGSGQLPVAVSQAECHRAPGLGTEGMCPVRGPTQGRREWERSSDSARVGGGGLVREKHRELMTLSCALCLVRLGGVGRGARGRQCFCGGTEKGPVARAPGS